MPKLPVISAKDLNRVLRQLGFFEHHRVGSHAQFKNRDGRRVTVPIHLGKDIKKKTLKSIINDLEVSVEEFIKIIKS